MKYLIIGALLFPVIGFAESEFEFAESEFQMRQEILQQQEQIQSQEQDIQTLKNRSDDNSPAPGECSMSSARFNSNCSQ